MTDKFSLNCPVPIGKHDRILLAHGGGGKLMSQLIETVFMPAFDNELLKGRHDGTVVDLSKKRVAFTTDSYVVSPLFFKGGDIGCLAVNGTVNDLAMCGARPVYLSAGFIIEEGFLMESLVRVVQSMRKAADEANVKIITGDTKVVERGKADGIFINTAGIGIIEHNLEINPARAEVGDVILINGDIGRHGIAIMAEREGLSFESSIESDCAPLNSVVQKLLDAGIKIHCMRDLTRGGLASALVEISSSSSKAEIVVDEAAIPVREDVQGACEILGFDPIYVANEGRFVVFVPAADSDRALKIMKLDVNGVGSCKIGEVRGTGAKVVMKNKIGTYRIVDMISGEQLPRIC